MANNLTDADREAAQELVAELERGGHATWMMPDEIAALERIAASMHATARRQEREAVVAWIRTHPLWLGCDFPGPIEAGEHLEADHG